MLFRNKLILTIFLAMIVSFAFILFASIAQIKSIVAENESRIIHSKINIMLSHLDQREKKIESSGLSRFYINRYKKERVKELQGLYVSESKEISKLVIFAAQDGSVSPWGETDPSSFRNSLLKQKEGSAIKNIEGKTWRVDYKIFKPWNWVVGFATLEDHSLIGVNSYIKNLGLMLFFVTCAVFSWLYFLLGRQTKPITLLAEEVKKFGEGKKEIDLNISTKDELGDLTLAFKDMAAKLSNYTDDLEQEVEKRAKVIEEQQMLLSNSAHLSSLGEMACGIAHEINNPLAVIKGNAHVVKKILKKINVEDLNVYSKIEKIDMTIDKISKIISGLQTISRDSSDDPMEIITLRPIFDDVLSLSRERFVSHGVDFEVEIEDFILDQHFLGRNVQIGQVLLNLLKNSFDAIVEREDKFLRIEGLIKDEKLVIKIIDSGEGIDQELVDKVFHPFFTTKPVGKGTGLGLSLSKAILEAHDGSFYYDGRADNTTFVFSLPLVSEQNIAS